MQFLEESPLLLRNWPIIIQGMVYILYLESIGHICYAFHLSSMHNSDNPMEYRHHTVSNKVHLNLWYAEESIYLAYSDFHPYVVGDLACTKELNRWFSKQFEKVNYVC